MIAIFTLGFIQLFSSSSEDEFDYSQSLSGSKKIAYMELSGPIMSSEKFVDQLERFKNESSIQGLIIRVDSPGGAVAPSQEIYESIKLFRETGRPVVVSVSSLCASGAYYAAMGADKIVANNGSLIGSIGVIMQFPQVKGLMDKVGIEMTTIKSGEFKDTGSPFRKHLPTESSYLQSVIDDTYSQFVEVVSTERKIELSEMKKMAQGQIYTGRQAEKLGLIDTIGTYDVALSMIGKLANIDGKPSIIKERKRVSFWDKVLTEVSLVNLYQHLIEKTSIIQYRMAL